jgi:alpha-mannosidase
MRSVNLLKFCMDRTRPRRQRLLGLLLAGMVAFALPGAARAQTMKASDISKVPTLFVVPYAHLDTQWRWEMPQSISEYMLKTMKVNFYLINKYPHYVFNWTGSNRYRLMKEYFPADYAELTKYVAEGRWFPAGSSVEEGDVNLPSAEGIFRQILYGNDYYRKDFGKASNEFMLPDCFGFPASLPSILEAAGLKGFSTQKLTAIAAGDEEGGPNSIERTPDGVPFNVGMWVGPDGKGVIAALNPGSYSGGAYTDLSKAPEPEAAPTLPPDVPPAMREMMLERMRRMREPNWVSRINLDGKVSGVYADYHYVGTGDVGGGPTEATVKLLEAIVDKSKTVLPERPMRMFGRGAAGPRPLPGMPDTNAPEPTGPEVQVGMGPVHVVESAADQMFNDITPAMEKGLPEYRGDLELINHSAGSLTSEAYNRRIILRNEQLANAAEETSVAAQWMGGRTYPQQRLNNAWILELAGHFHDVASGTATPQAYQYAWNDDNIAANQFAGVLTSASEEIASGLNTAGTGTAVVVYNPLNIAREDVAEAKVDFPGGTPAAVRVTGPDGNAVPSQLEGDEVVFLAKAPSVGFAVYHVTPATSPYAGSELKVTENSLENAHYRVELDADGDVSSIYDKDLHKELLAAPMRLAISTDAPKQWPAWNMDFDQEQAAPRAYVSGPAQIRIVENGSARVAIEVTRETEGSKFAQTVSLAAGDAGDRVVFGNAIDWKTLSANLKATFALTAENPMATYNLDVGTIQRPDAFARQFEVVSHQWIDLTDASGRYGATILSEYKRGSDKPRDNTIRLTLIRTPGIPPPVQGANGMMRSPGSAYTDQENQDWGHHVFKFGLAGHKGDWRTEESYWQAFRLADPLMAFTTADHPGALGRSFSLVRISNSHIRLLALKKAENSNEIILRLVELDGKPENDVRISFAGPITSVRSVNAQELPLGPVEQAAADATAHLSDGTLVTSFTPYQPRTFALWLGPAATRLKPVRSEPVALKYDVDAASNNDTKTVGGGFDGQGNALPAEMVPEQITYHGVEFRLAPAKTGVPDAVAAKGQRIELPAGHYNRVYVLAAAADQDQTAEFRVGTATANLDIEDWGGFIGEWDTRMWKNQDTRDWAISANPTWPPANLREREERVPSPRYPEDYLGLQPGFVKPAGLAWYCSHHHTADGLNEPYQYSYLFAYAVDKPENARTLTLPDNDKIKILAVSVAEENPTLTVAHPLYDMMGRTEPTAEELSEEKP